MLSLLITALKFITHPNWFLNLVNAGLSLTCWLCFSIKFTLRQSHLNCHARLKLTLWHVHFFNTIGCGKLWVVDGQWKLMFADCMMYRKV